MLKSQHKDSECLSSSQMLFPVLWNKRLYTWNKRFKLGFKRSKYICLNFRFNRYSIPFVFDIVYLLFSLLL